MVSVYSFIKQGVICRAVICFLHYRERGSLCSWHEAVKQVVWMNGLGHFILYSALQRGYLSILLQDYLSWLCIVLHYSLDWCRRISINSQEARHSFLTSLCNTTEGKGEIFCHPWRNREIGSSSNGHQRAKEDVGLPTLLQITAF